MDPITRRTILAASAGGLAVGAGTAAAQAPDAPQPIRGADGATVLGPRNLPLARENPDALTPPATDHGDMPNLKWSFAQSHTRLEDGGWARQTTVRELPVSTSMAGVNMRLDAGGVREMHWHLPAEWSLMLYGQGAHHGRRRRTGASFVADVKRGRPVVLPVGRAALDPGARAGRLRVPAGVRRRRVLGGQHLPDHRLARAHAAMTSSPRTSACRNPPSASSLPRSSTSSRRRRRRSVAQTAWCRAGCGRRAGAVHLLG